MAGGYAAHGKVFAHDGIQEEDFNQWLQHHNYKGAVIWDDIHIGNPMIDWWNRLTVEKYDFTKSGHHSGTGLTIYN